MGVNLMTIDIQTDNGFSTFMELANTGKLDNLDANLDLDMLIQKQAYEDDESFADIEKRQYSIRSQVETELSARYAEKFASKIPSYVLDRIDEACDLYGVEKVARELYPINTANEMFSAEEEESEKYASSTEYGTELNTCLAARALLFPDHAEDLEELAKLASTVPPITMVDLIKEADEIIGADLPWITSRVGSAEYAVFEKRASEVMVCINDKMVEFEKIAELDEVLQDMGVNIDFDGHDPYTIKTAVETLPSQIKDVLYRYV